MGQKRIDDPHTNAGLKAAIIAEQNDSFRRDIAIRGEVNVPEGRVVVTEGIENKGPVFRVRALRKIAEFTEFTFDSDPRGLHEMGVVEVQSETVWWKIDLYGPDYISGSVDPMDTAKTRRVLTVLLQSQD